MVSARALAPSAALLAVLLAPAAASAGLGTTFYAGTESAGEAWGLDYLPAWSGPGRYPSLDWRNKKIILQFHVLEFLDHLADEDVFIGLNGMYQVWDGNLGRGAAAVIQPGLSVDVFGDPFVFSIGALGRFGGEIGDGGGTGGGLYVVPVLGLAIVDDEAELLTGGSLQVSIWFGK
jgi:hypothetical protein